MTQRVPTGPDLDRRISTVLSGPTTPTWKRPCTSCGALGHESAGLQAQRARHTGGAQQGLGIREHAPDAEGARRGADIEVQGIEPPRLGVDRVREEELERNVLHRRKVPAAVW